MRTTILIAIAAAGIVLAQEGKAVYISGESATFKEVSPGLFKTTLWGDTEKGPYGAYTRMAPGQKFRMHTHSNDLRIVVLEGAYVYKAGGETIRVGRKGYLFIPGGTPHESGSDEKAGVFFYEESTGKF